MRVITGKARGVQLKTPDGMTTRPTADRVKEALFSIIQFEIPGAKVLDLFGGTGQLGIEALSRGAKSAVFVDAGEPACRLIRENLRRTKLESDAKVVRSDYLEYLKRSRDTFNIIFLDPPYAAGLVPPCLALLHDRKLLAAGAIVAVETASYDDVFGQDAALQSLYCVKKQSRYGVAHITLLTSKEELL